MTPPVRPEPESWLAEYIQAHAPAAPAAAPADNTRARHGEHTPLPTMHAANGNTLPLPNGDASWLENGSLGVDGYTFGHLLRDIARARGPFAPSRPAGALLDLLPFAGEFRAGGATRELTDSGHPIAAGITALAAGLPVVGPAARDAVRGVARGAVRDAVETAVRDGARLGVEWSPTPRNPWVVRLPDGRAAKKFATMERAQAWLDRNEARVLREFHASTPASAPAEIPAPVPEPAPSSGVARKPSARQRRTAALAAAPKPAPAPFVEQPAAAFADHLQRATPAPAQTAALPFVEDPMDAARAGIPRPAEAPLAPPPPANPYAHLPEPPRVYHGTPHAFESFDPAKMDAQHALFGPGLYFTDNPDVAAGYADKFVNATVPPEQRGEVVRVLRAATEHAQNMNAYIPPVPPDEAEAAFARFLKSGAETDIEHVFGRNTFDKNLHDRAAAILDASRTKSPNVRPARIGVRNPLDMGAVFSPDDARRYFAAAVEHFPAVAEVAGREPAQRAAWVDKRVAEALAIQNGAPLTGEDLYRRLTSWTTGDMAKTNDFLRTLGHDGLVHEGGGRFTPGDPTRHRVTIAFSPEQIRSAFGDWRTAAQAGGVVGLLSAPTVYGGLFGQEPPQQ